LSISLSSPLRKRHFLLDSKFPDRLLQAGYQRTIDFIHFLFENYSKRGITEETDRVFAIFGLEARIATTLKCERRFGNFEDFLHRNLLWQPSGGEKMKRIDYGGLKVPSWSWMAYNGGIQFLNIPFSLVEG
jgi:hypothetical protein